MLCTVHIKMDYRSIFLCQVLFNLTKLGRGTIFFSVVFGVKRQQISEALFPIIHTHQLASNPE